MPTNTTDYLIRDIPTELHRAAKAKAASKGESLRDVLIRALEKYAGVKRED